MKHVKPLWKVKDFFNRTLWKESDVQNRSLYLGYDDERQIESSGD